VVLPAQGLAWNGGSIEEHGSVGVFERRGPVVIGAIGNAASGPELRALLHRMFEPMPALNATGSA
jgi:hypothetical protein